MESAPIVWLAALVLPTACFLFLHLAFERPRTAIQASLLLVLLAETDFMSRDPMASAAGVIDAQVVFELGIYFLLGVGLVIVGLSRAFHRRRLNTIEKLLIGFVGFALLSFAWSPTPRLSLVRGTQLCLLLALFMVALRVLDPPEAVRAVIRSVVVYVLVLGGSAALFPAAARGGAELGSARFSWFSVHPVVPATYSSLAAILLIAEGLFGDEGWRTRHFGIPVAVYLVPLLAILVLTKARAPLFAFLAVAGFLGSIRYFGAWAFPIALLLLPSFGWMVANLDAPVTGALSALSRQEAWYSELLLRGQRPDQFLAMTGRLGLWKDAQEAFLERPLIGYGYQGSRAALLAVRSWAGYAHNAFLQTLLDLGLVGTLLLWPAYLAYLVKRTVVCSVPERLRGHPWWQTCMFAGAAFLFINSLANETFAGPPTFQTLLIFAALLIGAARVRAPAPETATMPTGHRVIGRPVPVAR